MKRFPLLVAIASLVFPAAAHAAPGEPLLKGSETKALTKLFATYFRERRQENYKGIAKSYEDIKKKLASLAKSKKVPDLLVAVEDMRRVFGAPPEPEKRLKKGILLERSADFTLAGGEVMKVQYLLHLPRNYRHDVPTPAILALHPPMDRLDQVRKWFQAAYPKPILETAMVLVPLNHERKLDWSTMEGRQLAFFSVNDCYAHFFLDRGKLFLEGFGPTCQAAVDFATTYPSLLTALILRAPDAEPSVDLLANAQHVPMLMLAPESGDAAQVAASFVEKATQAGVPATLVSDAAGDGGRLGEQGAERLVAFVTETEKDFAPERIVFDCPSTFHTNAYWFHLSDPLLDVEPDKPIHIEAEVDRASNEFRIKTPAGLHEFTLYLNDRLVDLGKEIKVVHTVVNGDDAETVVRFQGTKARNLDYALKNWFNLLSGNFGEVYANSIRIEIPE